MSQKQSWRLALGIGSSVLGPVLGSFAAGVPGALVGGLAGTAVGVAVGRNRKDRLIALAAGVGSTAVVGIGTGVINTAAGNPLDKSVLSSIGKLVQGGASAASSLKSGAGDQAYAVGQKNAGGYVGSQANGNPQAVAAGGYQPPGQQFASPFDAGGSQTRQGQAGGNEPFSVSSLLSGLTGGGAAPGNTGGAAPGQAAGAAGG